MPDTLTKSDIVEFVHDQLGFQKNDSAETVEILIEIIKESLNLGEDVKIFNFGKFKVKNKKQRRGRRPVIGEES